MSIECDNMACVMVLNSGTGKDAYLHKCAREIWLISATYDFTITCRHITSKANYKADSLSRAHMDPCHMRVVNNLLKDYKLIDIESTVFNLTANI